MNIGHEIDVPPRRVRFALLAMLAVATLAVYSRALFCDFVYYDDGLYVFDNVHVRNGITFAGLKHVFITGETGTWQPIALLSHMIDCQLFGLNPWGHHLSSIVLHAANAVLLAIAITRLAGRFYPGLAVAAIFALHPAHVESVAWVSERKDVLSAFFWMLCLVAYERYARSGGVARYMALISMLVLGLMTKPMLVTVPCVLLLLDFWPLRRFDRGFVRLFAEKAPLFAIVAVSSVITIIVQRQNQAIVSMENLPLATRLGNVAVSYVKYLVIMIWPSGLAIDYPHPKDTLSALQIVASCGLLAALTIAAFAARYRAPFALVGWLWYVGTLVPVVGFIHVGEQGMADRYTYIPAIGLAMAIVWLVDTLLVRTVPRRGAYAGAMIVLITLLAVWSALTWKQVGYWKNTETLWARAVDVNPANERAQRNLGSVLIERSEFANAIPHFETAIRSNPRDPRSWHGLAYAHMRLGNTERALDLFAHARQIDPHNVDTRNNIGVCLLRLNRDAEAEHVLREAAGVPTADEVLASEIVSNLGVALWRNGQFDEASSILTDGIKRYPEAAKLHNIFGIVLNSKGLREDALAQFREALRIDPAFEDARRNIDALGK